MNPERTQAEHIASVLYDEIDRIRDEALYAGQAAQHEQAVRCEFIQQVADIIQKELGT